MTVFIDAHAHLDGKEFAGDLPGVLARAKDAGITHIVTIGASDGLRANYDTLAVADVYPHVFATVGVHPHDAKIVDAECLAEVERLSHRPKVVAIGETGLDYHYDHSPRQKQREVFRAFLNLARSRGLPAVVHTREADEDTIEILRGERAEEVGGCLHSFTGGVPLARAAIDLGWYVSFSGILTFKTADNLRTIAQGLPRDRVLVETDCPFLAPIPFRGKRNEPAYIVHTAGTLAKLWNVSLEEVKRMTGENAARFYRLTLG